VGHRECFIANSLTTEIAIEAEILRVGHEQGDG
jgi:hypothetical protein